MLNGCPMMVATADVLATHCVNKDDSKMSL